MNKVILSWDDISKVIGKWAVENKKLVYSYPMPLKNFQIIVNNFWEAEIERHGNKVKIHHTIDGVKRGYQIFKLGKHQEIEKDKSTLQGIDKFSMLTTYISLMAYMTYARDTKERIVRKTTVHRIGSPRRAGEGHTYILHRAGTTAPQGGHHRSPQGIFTVRGHYRRYRTGKTVWIKEYRKGTGKELERNYKL